MTATVHLAEDDDGIAQPLRRALEREGYTVTRSARGEETIDEVLGGDVDVLLLDLELDDVDGLEVCRRLREHGSDVAILMLTARSEELDRVVGLDIGADDYLTKPFGLAELFARIRVLLRRRVTRASGTASEQNGAEGLRIDEPTRRVYVGAEELLLSVKEFGVLSLLTRAAPAVVTREQLIDEVWDEHWFGSTKTLDVTVGRLRSKLERHGSDRRIVTVRGVGFRLEDLADV
jgi:DNA-binding response OmpR family regulator